MVGPTIRQISVKIFLTTCETHNNAYQFQKDILLDLWTQSSKKHFIVDNIEDADIILIGNLIQEDSFHSFRTHPIIHRYSNKCFTICDTDRPLPLLRGIYTSADKRLWFSSRYRTGCYALLHPDLRNPFIDNYKRFAYEQEKQYLLSFVGRNCHRVRKKILTHKYCRKDVFIKDTSGFTIWNLTQEAEVKIPKQKEYVEILEKSKFALCPRGHGPATIRLFEAMKIGVAPIIISDHWILPNGPQWNDFAIIVRESDVVDIEEILTQNERKYREMGQAAASAYRDYFSEISYFDYLIDQVIDITKHQSLPEGFFWNIRHILLVVGLLNRRIKRNLRNLKGRASRWVRHYFR